jgi:hypothetical protein
VAPSRVGIHGGTSNKALPVIRIASWSAPSLYRQNTERNVRIIVTALITERSSTHSLPTSWPRVCTGRVQSPLSEFRILQDSPSPWIPWRSDETIGNIGISLRGRRCGVAPNARWLIVPTGFELPSDRWNAGTAGCLAGNGQYDTATNGHRAWHFRGPAQSGAVFGSRSSVHSSESGLGRHHQELSAAG